MTTIPDAVLDYTRRYHEELDLPEELREEAAESIKAACREIRKLNGFSEEELR